jgi:hypothetical protein
MLLLSLITFISAFLLFQIELIIAKLFLPNYGGSYLVWGACVVFFQAALLAGYVFSHWMVDRFKIKTYLKIHLGLLLLPFFFFPGHTIHVASQAITLPLVLDVFIRLIATIGPVFFVLSTASLVTQSWLASSNLKRKSHPYILYAISNIGSFAALWSYPFVFEYFLTNSEQLNLWRLLYVALVVLNIWAWKTLPVTASTVHKEEAVPVTRATAIKWLMLSAAGVVLFLSVTNIITYEVAPVPLLWIIPLSIYLLSFVLTFKSKPWAPKWLQSSGSIIILAAILLYFQTKVTFLSPAWAIILFNLVLFLLCIYSQHELIKSRPAQGNLTFFYVMISLGGFLGGFVTSWIIPSISKAPVEFLFGLGLIAAAFPKKNLRSILLICVAGAFIFDSTYKSHQSLVKLRNYYGIYDIFDRNGVRTFVHGTTLHGLEWTDPARRYIPLGYYSPMSPMGEVIIKDVFQAKRLGAVGLGAGTMAMYSKPSMSIDFYELDPDVVNIAQKHFWYLSYAPGSVRVAVGDARMSLSNTPIRYDLLVIDAFGGDSIPVHLVNKDVMILYRSRLSDRGGILLHIPNRYFDLEPVLSNIARELGAYVAIKESKQDGITMHTFWAVMTWDQERFAKLTEDGWRPLDQEKFKKMRTWTDQFSTVLPILKFQELLQSLQHFKIR